MSHRFAAVAFLITTALAAQQTAPPPLRELVPNRSHARGEAVTLGTANLLAMRTGERPFLLWPQAGGLGIANTQAAAAAWLRAHADGLGHGVFAPVFADRFVWQAHDVLRFSLQHDGLPLHDAEVWVCFQGDTCVGIVNRVPAGLATPPARTAGVDPVWAIVRGQDGAQDRLVQAERTRTRTATHDVVELAHGGVTIAREWTTLPQPPAEQVVLFTEFAFGGFPDQIAADARGTIWCSDPTGNRLLAIDPQTGTATFHPTSPWAQPDGLCVDDKDRVWTGFYTSGHGLGRFDALGRTWTRHAAPYANAQLAIPTWTHTGSIWITDHVANRLSEFRPASGTFGPGISLAAGSYPVGAAFDNESGDLFVALWTRNAIAQVRNGALLRTLPTPVLAGPAFCAVANGKVWFTYWSTAQLGVLDLASATFTTHSLPAGELGGPIDVGPNGHVYVGTRSRGYIVDFDPVTATSVAHAIPTPNPGLKDGLTVAPDGTVWFTGSTTGRVVRLKLP